MWFDEKKSSLGSVLRVTFEHPDQLIGTKLLLTCWERIDAFEKKYSRFLPGNMLENMNVKIGEWQSVDAETFGHLRRVRDLEDRYALGFSLAVKGILERLGYDSSYSFQVQRGKNNKKADEVIARDFLLRNGEVFIDNPIEFGGFGKGYALDMVVEVLGAECQNICLDFGGDLYVKGVNEKGEKWKMIIESPFHVDEAIGTVDLDGLFLTTSNTLKRRWGANGKYHHLIDPATGTSANYWTGVSVLADSGMEADFLATALFCTSADGIDVASNSLLGSHFLLVDRGGKIYQHDFPCVLFSEE